MNHSEPSSHSASSGADASGSSPAERQWRPLTRAQRRIAGVLIEKAKTTPNAYPLTLNAIVTASNQKSNRSPQMQLSPEQTQDGLDQLREMGAVVEVQGGGRVAKYKHLLYEWLGVSRDELSVMAELLLRGEQTLGDLRSRARRMCQNKKLEADQLKEMIQELMARDLVVALTPEGRGQLVTHNLYDDDELTKLRGRLGQEGEVAASPTPNPATTTAPATTAPEATAPATTAPEATAPEATAPASSGVTLEMFEELQQEIVDLRAEIAALGERLRSQASGELPLEEEPD